jgi:hypothetical protein
MVNLEKSNKVHQKNLLLFKIINTSHDQNIIDFYDNNWDNISSSVYINESFIQNNEKSMNWDILSKYKKFTWQFVIKNKHNINWDFYSKKVTLSFINRNPRIINEIREYLRWDLVDYQGMDL